MFRLSIPWSDGLCAGHRLLSILADHIYMAAVDWERRSITLERIAEAFDGRQVALRPDDIATIDIRYDVGHIFMKS